MIHIGIDISKTSTALCIERNGKTLLFSYTTQKPNNIWIKDTSDFIFYRFVNYSYKDIKDYSEREMNKFDEFEEVSDLIINDIFDNINILDSVSIAIEGFSFSSAAGPIIDLVELSTLIKHKIKSKVKGMVSIKIVAPLSLKVFSCELVYNPIYITKGKRVIKKIKVVQDTNGKLGKDFDKKDMFEALLISDIRIGLIEHLKDNKVEFLKNKSLPKPIDDIIDSIFLKELIKSKWNINI